MLVASGGAVERTSVIGLSHDDSGWQVRCENGMYQSENVVLAAGAWSAEIAAGLDMIFRWHGNEDTIFTGLKRPTRGLLLDQYGRPRRW